MREINFSQHWPKLDCETIMTFRCARRDKDWAVGERVRLVLHARSKQRKVLFEADIVAKEPRWIRVFPSKPFLGQENFPVISSKEAEEDGFKDDDRDPALFHLWEYMWQTYGARILKEPVNKLTLRRVKP